MLKDTAFQMAASNIRFGRGITHELGMDLVAMDVRRTMVVIDPALVSLPAGETVLESLEVNGIDYRVFDAVAVEPTDSSFKAAAEFAVSGNFDSIVAVGGGSAIDTAKAANENFLRRFLRTYRNLPQLLFREVSRKFCGP